MTDVDREPDYFTSEGVEGKPAVEEKPKARKRLAASFSTEEIDGLVRVLKRVSQLTPEVMAVPGVRSVQDKFIRMQEKLDR